jgi:hypothetical protein
MYFGGRLSTVVSNGADAYVSVLSGETALPDPTFLVAKARPGVAAKSVTANRIGAEVFNIFSR